MKKVTTIINVVCTGITACAVCIIMDSLDAPQWAEFFAFIMVLLCGVMFTQMDIHHNRLVDQMERFDYSLESGISEIIDELQKDETAAFLGNVSDVLQESLNKQIQNKTF